MLKDIGNDFMIKERLSEQDVPLPAISASDIMNHVTV